MDPLANVSQPAPDLSLLGLDNRSHRLSDEVDHKVVLNFWSVECPWAQRVEDPLTGLRSTWPADVLLWPIASNAEEAAEEIASAAAQREPPLVLLDRDHAVADL